MKDRVFVNDPVCALPYGHNVVGLKYFSDAVRPFFRNVVPIASIHLPNEIALKYGFERDFDFYYHEHISLDLPTERRGPHGRTSRGGDPMLHLALRDATAFFEKYAITAEDSIVYPCVDYYGAMGVLGLLERSAPVDAPTVYLRFIGVMENATSVGLPGLPGLVMQIKKMLARGHKIKLCAETPRYADYLARELASAVSVVPYPIHADMAQVSSPNDVGMSDRNVFRVSCPGSARLDKGYLTLLDIFSAIRRIDPKQSIRFVTQALAAADALQHTNYTNQLYAIPGVNILPSSISEEEMNDLYMGTDLVLLPYDPATYANRGSAVFMECISRGIPVVALAGSAFCDQIVYYGAGSVVPNPESLAKEILKFREASRKSILNAMTQARHRYSTDVNSNFVNWITQ